MQLLRYTRFPRATSSACEGTLDACGAVGWAADVDVSASYEDRAAIVVSNVIGSGIFIVPAFVAQGVPTAWGMLSVWLAGGLLAFAGAMAYAELATLRPRAGGEYVYLREAFGPVAGFLTGWTSFVAGFSGAIAIMVQSQCRRGTATLPP